MSNQVSKENQGTAVIIGVGPTQGLGAALARRFALEGLHVFIGARDGSRLQQVAEEIENAGGTATAMATDATDETAVGDLITAADSSGAGLQLAVYNAGNNYRKEPLDLSVAEMENVWRVACLGGFITGREAGRAMIARGAGSLIFTGATASLRARPPFTAFASAKFALRAVAQAMARDFGPKGVHVGHVVIDGGIKGEKLLAGVPGILERVGEEGLLDINHIADAYWHLHSQGKTAWTFELDLRPNGETF